MRRGSHRLSLAFSFSSGIVATIAALTEFFELFDQVTLVSAHLLIALSSRDKAMSQYLPFTAGEETGPQLYSDA
jgi:hypothetical protein